MLHRLKLVLWGGGVGEKKTTEKYSQTMAMQVQYLKYVTLLFNYDFGFKRSKLIEILTYFHKLQVFIADTLYMYIYRSARPM